MHEVSVRLHCTETCCFRLFNFGFIALHQCIFCCLLSSFLFSSCLWWNCTTYTIGMNLSVNNCYFLILCYCSPRLLFAVPLVLSSRMIKVHVLRLTFFMLLGVSRKQVSACWCWLQNQEYGAQALTEGHAGSQLKGLVIAIILFHPFPSGSFSTSDTISLDSTDLFLTFH